MLRSMRSPALRRAADNLALPARRALSDAAPASKQQPSALAGDSGRKATHLHHHMTTLLAASFPLYCLTPDSYSDGMMDKALGVVVGSTVAAHGWIGLNYVATDYVPKISKGLMGPARAVVAGLGLVTFLGLNKVALNGKGGLRGTVKGLWRPVEKKEG
mmetsp:Transcript_57541/g.122092  ORF Transcript_57541/g.122092 Transcript_57541/m.122092 type:complete len:159 (+) Transcript_57541:216-692(+)